MTAAVRACTMRPVLPRFLSAASVWVAYKANVTRLQEKLLSAVAVHNRYVWKKDARKRAREEGDLEVDVSYWA